MKVKLWNRCLSLFMAGVLLVFAMPTTTFAAHDSSGKPTDLNNALCLSIYTGEGFPGEPAVNSKANYKSFKSDFTVGALSWLFNTTFKNSAGDELDPKVLEVLEQGASSGSTRVWGVYDSEGIREYFLENSSILKPENEAKIIRAIKGLSKNVSDEAVLAQYEVIWYVIKYQTSDGWHIDGTIKEKEKRAVHYYGNGNTSGTAPEGSKTIVEGSRYTVLGNTGNMKKQVDGVYVDFLGWNTAHDGSGITYQPGDTFVVDHDVSLYAVWDTHKTYTATVKTYLNDENVSATEIYGKQPAFYLSSDGAAFTALTETGTGEYATQITKNGNYGLYCLEDGVYSQVVPDYLTINSRDGDLSVHYYSVRYETDGGTFKDGENPGGVNYISGSEVAAVNQAPVKSGYTFQGWRDQDGNMIQPGSVAAAAIAKETVLTAQWTNLHTITASATNGGTATGGGEYEHGANVTLSAVANDGYTFLGWYENGTLVTQNTEYAFTAVEDRTFVAKFANSYVISTVVEGGGSATVAQAGGKPVASGAFAALTKVTLTAQPDGSHYFIGWYDGDELITSEEQFTYTVLTDKKFVAKFEAKKYYRSDYVYILGYNDALIAAEGPLLRSEVSQMIYRLVKQNNQLGGFYYNASNAPVFSDTAGKWFRSGIEYMNYRGAFLKRDKVYPDAQVTRGEVYKLICLGLGFAKDADLSSRNYATILYNSGYISADEAGDIKITGKMTRWEFCVLFNNILGRTGAQLVTKDGTEVTAQTYGYTDLDESAHYYKTMMLATSTFSNGYVDLVNRRERNDLDDFNG